MCGSTSAGFFRRTAAVSSSRSSKAFSPAMSNTTSPPASKSSSTSSPIAKCAWRDVLRDFWRDFIGAIDETKDLKISQVIDALDDLLAPHLFPPRDDGTDPRQCPTCSTGRLSLKLSQIRRLHRLLELSGMPLYPLAVGVGRRLGDIGTKKLGEDPKTGLDVTVRSGRFGPYVQLGETVKDAEKPKRAGLPKGRRARRGRSRSRARAAIAAARNRHASRGRRADHRRHRPFRALCEARQDLRQSRNRRRRLQYRAQPRGDADRREEAPRGRASAVSAPIRAVRSASIRARGGPIVAKNGRYGPYVSHDGVNATLPSDKTPETITLEEAAA